MTPIEFSDVAKRNTELSNIAALWGPDRSIPQAQYRLDILAKWPIGGGARVLELGCRQGDMMLALAKTVGENGRTDAVDPAPFEYGWPRSIREAQDLISASPLGSRIKWVQAKPLDFLAAHLEAKYDTVVLVHSLWYFGSPELILETLHAVSKHARCICIAEWSMEGVLECHKGPDFMSESNVRTVVFPAKIKVFAAQAGLLLKEEGLVTPHISMGWYGQVEVGYVAETEWEHEVEERVADERAKSAI
ncbi:hypothetical protein C8F04DRAFT_1213187 [Mycena alexandri]|uniref:Methyltransferase domain-containing protein n=1 Tax=Mycena alexandri TaxID=1745969 RepID=A0AAD6SD90_9AGAR|nr:hypothetical protein C8F04DRAFT_1213187 [Mycena alexandri]